MSATKIFRIAEDLWNANASHGNFDRVLEQIRRRSDNWTQKTSQSPRPRSSAQRKTNSQIQKQTNSRLYWPVGRELCKPHYFVCSESGLRSVRCSSQAWRAEWRDQENSFDKKQAWIWWRLDTFRCTSSKYFETDHKVSSILNQSVLSRCKIRW